MTKPIWYAFSIPDVADGLARLVDFAGTLEEHDHNFRISDSAAMAGDFAAVGSDIRGAVQELVEDEKLPA